MHTENPAIEPRITEENEAPIAKLVAGTMVTTGIPAARHFYEKFLGFECVQYTPDRLLLRDRYSKAAMEAGREDFFIIDVQEVPEIANPQRLLHHWGLDVASAEEVDRIHTAAVARQQEFGLNKILSVSQRHGAHSFYFADRDMNWWEVEYRLDKSDNNDFFARGDIGSKTAERSGKEREAPPFIDLAMPAADDVLVGNAALTHGTCQQLQLKRSRRFLEEVLHLRCVRHLEQAQMLAGRGNFGIFAIMQPTVKPQTLQNRWIICVDTPTDLDSLQARATAAKEELGLLQIGSVVSDGLNASVTIQDVDGNWWEATTKPPADYQSIFAAGDIDLPSTGI